MKSALRLLWTEPGWAERSAQEMRAGGGGGAGAGPGGGGGAGAGLQLSDRTLAPPACLPPRHQLVPAAVFASAVGLPLSPSFLLSLSCLTYVNCLTRGRIPRRVGATC